MYGWMGTILKVNLSSGKIEKEPLSDSLRLDYLGGRGINSRLLYDNVGTETDALSPENRLIFGTGLAVGTLAPSAGRFTVTAKSPLTGILGDGNAGGHFSLELKRAGYDHIVFYGKAERPVYLWVNDDHVELRPADHLWGKSISGTENQIHQELGDPTIKTASIGIAGENLVNYANIISESCHAIGRTGMGAVMGSKNLKAVAVKGTRGVRVAHPDAFMRLTLELHNRITDSPGYVGLADYGTPFFTQYAYDKGQLVIKNAQTNVWNDIVHLTHKSLARDYFVKHLACTACPRHCNQAWVIRDGPYAGVQGGKVEYATVGALGSGCLISDPSAVCMMNYLCDEYGLDVIELGVVLSATMEWYENGLITREDTGGINLTWGSIDGMITLIHQIAKRQGFGDFLAAGAVKTAQKLPHGAEKSIVGYAKGMTYSVDDVRATKGYALIVATATRGADHLRGLCGHEQSAQAEFMGVTPEFLKARFGTVEVGKPQLYNKAPLVVYTENLCTLADCLEICKFNTECLGETTISIKDIADLVSLITGVEMDEKAVRVVAERIWNVERAFLIREGITRKDDVLLGKWGTEPIVDGPKKGEKIDTQKFSHLLDEYYRLRGWDSNGIPTEATFKALGLKDIAKDVEKIRRGAPAGK